MTSINLFSDNQMSYEEELIYSFRNGSETNELKGISLEGGGGPAQPSCMTFDSNNNLIIADAINHRILVYNQDFTIKNIFYDNDEFYISSLRYLVDYENFIWGVSGSQNHLIMDKLTGKITRINISDAIGDRYTTRSIFLGNILFSYLKDDSICSFSLSNKESLTFSNMRTEQETKELFNNRNKYNLENYILDSKNRIFHKDLIINRDYKTMYSYWDELHIKNNENSLREVIGVPAFDKLSGASPIFLNIDQAGNSYWAGRESVIVFDRSGWPLAYFRLNEIPVCSFAVNLNGDVYFLQSEEVDNELVFNLYKIKKQW